MPDNKEQIQDLKLRLAAKTRELKIEDGLEKVRVVALRMREPADMLKICKMISKQLLKLGVKEVRNVQTAIFYESRGTYMNYEYYAKHDKSIITETHYNNNRTHKAFALKMLKGKGEFFVAHIKGKKVKDWIAYQKTTNVFIDKYLEKASSLNYYWHSLGPVALGISTYEPLSEEGQALFQRFLKVFELAYRRYLDIEKAVAQAREAKIQLALEKVRARTMSMQKSSELPEAANLLFRQVQTLGMPAWSAGYCIWSKDQSAVTLWMSTEGALQPPFTAPTTEDELFIQMRKGHEPGKPLHIVEMGGKKLVKHYRYMRTLPVVGEILDSVVKAGYPLPDFQIMHYAYFSAGFLLFITYEPVPAAHDIFIRFANVFDQTYTRFLDLQKAEDQAREAQIEVAVERIRAEAMAMHFTSDFEKVTQQLLKQIRILDLDGFSGASICLIDENQFMSWWDFASPGNMGDQKSRTYSYDSKKYKVLGRDILEKWQEGESYMVFEFDMEKLLAGVKEWEDIDVDIANTLKKAISDGKLKHQWNPCGRLSNGFLAFDMLKPPDDDVRMITIKMTHAFEQAYIRFRDIQKAEVQAREAQIETALEKVRSRTMAMHKSEELKDVIQVVYEQLAHLKIRVEHAGFILDYKTSDDMHIWLADPNRVPSEIRIPYFDSPHWNSFIEAKKKGNHFFANLLNFKEKNRFYNDLFMLFSIPDEAKDFYLKCPGLAISTVLLEDVGLYIENFSGTPYSEDENAILMRFGKVFQQTYTRFLDLKKAETQARESQIELGLERVRSRAMAMQKSDELKELIGSVFMELIRLDVVLTRCLIMIYEPNTKGSMWWMANSEAPAEPIGLYVKYHEQPPYLAYVKAWENRTLKWQFILEGKTKTAWDDFLFTETDLAHLPDFVIAGMKAPDRVFLNSSFNNFGNLTLASLGPLSEEHFEIMLRFAKVFDLTYTRFNDLQKAEASAREAVKQASLHRIRAEIASMRTPADLERITPLLWKELTVLGLPFIRCGVFIMDELRELIHTYLSTPDGNSIAAFDIPYHTPGSIRQVMSHWREYKSYMDCWDEDDFREFANNLVGVGALPSPEQYLRTQPAGGFYLHFLPFLQGMLYIGSLQALGEEALNLVQSVAEAFSTAYARYEDFNKLEAAKEQVDKALVDLRLTQQQLVQAEKMASLGELTAGIAHEIQNPLNFVNNFAEVNKELLDEIEGERRKEKGERDDRAESEILNTIRQNLEKINFHGKRADGIVKSMLQHSRSSEQSGKLKKEPTDINALADEYLRLAYHGLRAKDQTFNATLKTDFDDSMGLIQVIPQDIARVILNLITNAFYAVQEKGKKMQLKGESFSPTVSVTTKKLGDRVEIRVKDNGPGIPQHVLDKIFQPFFTTKPAG